MVEALIGALRHAAALQGGAVVSEMETFCTQLREAMHNTFRYGQGTRDMAGPDGFTTEDFVEKVAWRLGRYLGAIAEEVSPEHTVLRPMVSTHLVDMEEVFLFLFPLFLRFHLNHLVFSLASCFSLNCFQ